AQAKAEPTVGSEVSTQRAPVQRSSEGPVSVALVSEPAVETIPVRDAAANIAVGLDAASCAPTAAGASCNAVTQCGCGPGQGCGVLAIGGTSVQLGCVDPGTIANGGACTTETCAAGNTCVGALCRSFCGKDRDCGANGHCISALTDDANAQPVSGLSACFAGCAIDSDCATGCCRPLASAPAAGNLCLAASACCAQPGAGCSADGDCCGFAQDEALCVKEASGGAICRATCTRDADCQSGCCADLEGEGKACFAASQCQNTCAAANEPCQTNADCCGGASDAAVCVDQGQGPICADHCTVGSQCQSGCCAPLQVGGTVCAPPIFCP
ncbi:MAG TPA: hypothetical protein VFX59_12340, partial [Polyangiales bacterium]|nr:hypothetical protein [Polyangiales bacterium]